MNKKKFNNIISNVTPKSIACKMGVLPGDVLISVNDQKIKDVIDYRFFTTDEHLEILLKKPDGSEWVLEIDKDYDEDIGVEFKNPVMAATKECNNNCVFCFVDQMPPGMRGGLYIKDDDSRLSFLQGNYITLTNMKADEIQKLIRYRISPLNISVHTTNPHLRAKMLGNSSAANIMDQIKLFHDHDIKINVQIVLCPGYNDCGELDRTLMDLESVAPSLVSVAVVPVGTTKYQSNPDLVEVDSEKAFSTVKQIESWQKKWFEKFKRRLVYPSDEFYLKANLPWPAAADYEAFYQLENGVGMLASFENDLINYIAKLPMIVKRPVKLTVVTGIAAKPFMEKMAHIVMNKVSNMDVNIHAIENDFFGETITVSGLVTGRDLVKQLGGIDLGKLALIPESMLKADEKIFLDDMSIDDVSQALGVPVLPCIVDGEQWVRSLLRITSATQSVGSEKKYVKTNCCRNRAPKCR